jgi:hypothetical protein
LRNERDEYEQRAPSFESGGGFRWRPWPCTACAGGITATDFLRRSVQASRSVQQNALTPEKVAEVQSRILLDWVSDCIHSDWSEAHFRKLAEGSEHLVFLDDMNGFVWKITREGIYGDSYYLVDGIVNQRNCSPLEYLERLEYWPRLFDSGPGAIGISEKGQIVSRDIFVIGQLPSQEAVDSFLESVGLVAAKKSCWLWKKEYEDSEIWVGDARSDNFVETPLGIVPIDIRLWTEHKRVDDAE